MMNIIEIISYWAVAGGLSFMVACSSSNGRTPTTEDVPVETVAVESPDISTIKNQWLSTMQTDWNVLTPKIIQALDQLSEEQLAAESPFPIPFPEQSIRGLLGFQMHHLAYEIGQMALYRKFLGKEAMSYQ